MGRSTQKYDLLQDALVPSGLSVLALAQSKDHQYVLIGNVGDQFFEAFHKSLEYADALPHRLDRYSKRLLSELATIMPPDSRLIMPSDKPYAPFQQWALQGQQYFTSPLGLLIHAEYGLWTAFRGAWQVALGSFTAPETRPAVSPCDHCADKPCLSTCPVDAFSLDGFSPSACRQHLDNPDSLCWQRQCQARLACPIAQQWQYQPAAGRFFLHSFYPAVSNSSE